jgi:hypothetical protein
MTAEEFYRKRFIELSNDGIMKKLAKHVDIKIQSQICQEYAEYYEREKYNKKVKCGNCGDNVVMSYTTESFCPNCLY